jgi:hypothetical protein
MKQVIFLILVLFAVGNTAHAETRRFMANKISVSLPETPKETAKYTIISCALIVGGIATINSGWNSREMIPFFVGIGCANVGMNALCLTYRW